MTDVRSDDFTLIHSITDAIPLYQGNAVPAAQQRMGFETEIYLYKTAPDGTIIAATSQDCSKLLQRLKDQGYAPQLEMASAIEYASPALPVTEVAQLNTEIVGSWQAYQAAIEAEGLIASNASLLPFVTLESAANNLVDRDRARGLVKGMKMFKAPEFLKVTLLCTSTQVSLSYQDPDDLYNLLTTGYALSPAIYGLFGNYPHYIEGQETPVDFNPRAAFYEAFGAQGGIPKTLLEAKDGDDFIRRHATQVFETELLFYYDENKETVWPETPVRFEDLKALGLNTRSNYDLAESFLYSDIKVCNIRDDAGNPTGKRIEVRGIDAGAHGAAAAVPFMHALLRDPESHDAVEGLLLSYGVSPSQEGWQQRILAGRHAAAYHGGQYLDVPFGQKPDGTAGTLKAFCADLGDIMAQYAARNPKLSEALAPLIDICRSGITQAEAKAKATPNYAAANHALLTTPQRSNARNNRPGLKKKFG